jgi:acetyl-CoA acyltransferase
MHGSRRVAIIAGLRTPFARANTVLKDADGVDLARHVARELLYRTNSRVPSWTR